METLLFLLIAAGCIYCGGSAISQALRFMQYPIVHTWADYVLLGAGGSALFSGLYIASQAIGG